MNISKFGIQIEKFLLFYIINHRLFGMRTGFVVLAGLMAIQSVEAGVKLDVGGCKLTRKIEREEVECPCSGGSGDYEWKFDQLPEKWKNEDGKLYAEKGKFEEKKVYGTKV